MIHALALAAVTSSPMPRAHDDRAAVAHAAVQRHPGERVGTVILHGSYAYAIGTMPRRAIHDGLHLGPNGWRVVCTFAAAPSATQMQSQCGFPAGIAAEFSANVAAQTAAQSGHFTTALHAEERAYLSAVGPARDDERARVQLLHQLAEQMRTGAITRSQAIQKWNQFTLTWALP